MAWRRTAEFVALASNAISPQSFLMFAAVDGGVETATIEDLRDMRRWSDQATSEDWAMQP